MWTLGKYRETQKKTGAVREKRDSYSFPYSERHLQCVWYDPSFRPENILTSEGEQVHIQHPGRWNLEAGPDFLDAILSIGQPRRTIKGDVEIHIHPNDWSHHRHTGDARYNGVVAHVTYFPQPLDKINDTMISISLKDTLAAASQFSFESIDITAYPFHSITKARPPCATSLKHHSPEYFDQLLCSAGLARIKQKRNRIRDAMDHKGCEQVFYEEIMRTLGYKNNRIPFKHLAQQIPIELLQQYQGTQVLCLKKHTHQNDGKNVPCGEEMINDLGAEDLLLYFPRVDAGFSSKKILNWSLTIVSTIPFTSLFPNFIFV